MSIVNSFVNQIGRELGRDAYRSVRSSSARKGSQRIIQEEVSLLDQVKNFELLASDEKTFRHLANLVEKAEHTDHEDFEWNELFYELDNKIDFCKANLSSEFQMQLDKLDELNANNFKYIKAKHVTYIDSVILHFENKATDLSKKNVVLASVLTVIGLRPSYMGEKGIYTAINVLYLFLLAFIFHNGWMAYHFPALNNGNLPNETPAELALIMSMGKVLLGIAVGFYALYFILGIRKIFKFRKEVENNVDSKVKFETYRMELLK